MPSSNFFNDYLSQIEDRMNNKYINGEIDMSCPMGCCKPDFFANFPNDRKTYLTWRKRIENKNRSEDND